MSDQGGQAQGSGGGEAPKIIVDTDWKAQAQAEKAKMAEQEQQTAGAPGEEGRQGEMPPANFRSLLGSLVSQALLYMGGFPDPETGRAMVSIEYAKHYIDLVEVLEEKTKGNLDEDEQKEITGVLSELRSRFVALSQEVQRMIMEEQGKAGGGQQPPGGVAGP